MKNNLYHLLLGIYFLKLSFNIEIVGDHIAVNLKGEIISEHLKSDFEKYI